MEQQVKIEMGGRYFPFERAWDHQLPRRTAEAAAKELVRVKRLRVRLVVQESPEDLPVTVAEVVWDDRARKVVVR